ncbi:Holliday junction branch migration protein RuvA [Heliobacterium gestii]|uniref:Holliday junction branch migration complex subunit RuvA n=1 Tax=Heliomicrobium gestii TaxID=2699 RepID=A0A845LHC1_HELGE|nr:Holliday junction branch migration protein RuvA [Heliomicrobium gestii]MBM7868059.1 Holliday junction DNA helicase RuvA [Heliomicrobium gestii]MZP44410.1 Holliday junction branch migration protein RuvA [Heliomicrobium gestii]
MIAFLRGRLAGVGDDCLLVDVSGVGYRVFVPATMLASLPRVGREVLIHTYYHTREDQVSLFGFIKEEDLEFFRLLLEVSGVGPKVGLGILSAYSAMEVQRAIIAEDVLALTRIPGIGRKTAQRLVIELRDKLLKQGLRVVPVLGLAQPVGLSSDNSENDLPQEDTLAQTRLSPDPSPGNDAQGEAATKDESQDRHSPEPAEQPARRRKKATAVDAGRMWKTLPRDEAFSALQVLGYSANEARDALVDAAAHVSPDGDVEAWIKGALRFLGSQ